MAQGSVQVRALGRKTRWSWCAMAIKSHTRPLSARCGRPTSGRSRPSFGSPTSAVHLCWQRKHSEPRCHLAPPNFFKKDGLARTRSAFRNCRAVQMRSIGLSPSALQGMLARSPLTKGSRAEPNWTRAHPCGTAWSAEEGLGRRRGSRRIQTRGAPARPAWLSEQAAPDRFPKCRA